MIKEQARRGPGQTGRERALLETGKSRQGKPEGRATQNERVLNP